MSLHGSLAPEALLRGPAPHSSCRILAHPPFMESQQRRQLLSFSPILLPPKQHKIPFDVFMPQRNRKKFKRKLNYVINYVINYRSSPKAVVGIVPPEM